MHARASIVVTNSNARACKGDLVAPFPGSNILPGVFQAQDGRKIPSTLIPKKRLKFVRKCSSLYEYAASLCVLVRDENRQLIAILRANVIRKIPIAKIESEYSSTTILQSEYLSTRAIAHGGAAT